MKGTIKISLVAITQPSDIDIYRSNITSKYGKTNRIK